MEASNIERAKGRTYQAGCGGVTPSTQNVPSPTAEPSPADDVHATIAQPAFQLPHLAGPAMGSGSTM
eukprot:11522806-Prorocentrum_lima.AAC.1